MPGDLILLAGAGDIINLVPRIQRDLSSFAFHPQPFTSLAPLSFFRTGGATVGGGERTIVGMGSNFWFSDCVTDIEIVRAPAAEPNLPLPKGILTLKSDKEQEDDCSALNFSNVKTHDWYNLLSSHKH